MTFGSGLRRIKGGRDYYIAVGRNHSLSVSTQAALVAERAVLSSDSDVCMNIPFIAIVHHAY